MFTRRQTVTALLAAATAAVAPAIAETDPILRLGVLTGLAPMSPDSPLGKILIGALADLGYTVGKNLNFEARGAMTHMEKLPGLIGELKAQGSRIFVTAGYPTTVAAKAAGIATVVYTGAGDPVATGLVESWAHPGGVVTGISDIAATLTVKRLEFLKALSPNLKRVAMLWNADDRAMTLRYEASAATARMQGLTIQGLGVREPDDFNGAFEAMDRDKPDAILMVSDALMILNRKRIIDFAAARRLPAIYEADNYARDGGLMSYGADFKECLTRAAAMVDRIFKGTRPGDIPFEQPTRYLFVMNLKVARAMGLDPPVTLLGLADEVIE
jgi:putative ABC transport system substrate-binding protein